MILNTIVCSSQNSERIVLAKGSAMDFRIEKSISNSTDTMVYFYFGFQNKDYQSITDIGSFMIYRKEDLRLFVNVLKQISLKEDGIDFSALVGRYGKISLHSFDPLNIYFRDKNNKYTTISKNKANEIVKEIEANIDLLKY